MSISIKINPDGTFADYVPRKVFSALFYKDLVKKVNGKWMIPEEKRSLVENLEIVSDPKTDLKKRSKKDYVTKKGLTVSVGDLFYTSWGYDQTNYNFLVVVGFSPSKKSAYCKMTSAKLIEDECGRGTDALKPVNAPYGERFLMKIQLSFREDEIQLRGSYPYINGIVNDGRRLDTFYLVKPEKIYHETAAGWGH